MRINQENKSVDMESRDINYILPAYVRSYLFYNENKMPEKIIFPMFVSVIVESKEIPIEWVPPLEDIAVEIQEDGSNVAEVTPAQEAALDEKDEEIKKLKDEVATLTQTERGGEEVRGTPSASPMKYTCQYIEKDNSGEYIACSNSPDRVPCIYGQFDFCPPEVSDEEEETAALKAKMTELTEPEGLTEEEQIYEAAKADQPEPAPEDLTRQQQETDDEPKTLADEMPDEEPEISPAKQAFAKVESEKPAAPERQPKQPPGGDLGPGMNLSDTQPRDSRDQLRTAKDLKDEPDIKEEEEVPFDKEVSRDETGKPIVEDKPDA